MFLVQKWCLCLVQLEYQYCFHGILSDNYRGQYAPVIPRLNTANRVILCFTCPKEAVPISSEGILLTFNSCNDIFSGNREN